MKDGFPAGSYLTHGHAKNSLFRCGRVDCEPDFLGLQRRADGPADVATGSAETRKGFNFDN